MEENSLSGWLERNSQKDELNNPFALENPFLLEINLHGSCWAKSGSMIAYQGAVTFLRETLFDRGVSNALKAAFAGEGTRLMKMEGIGRIYLADHGKRVQLLNLTNEVLFVNSNDLLALEPGIEFEVSMMRRISGLRSGGFVNVRLAGRGFVALTTHATPIVLRVTEYTPVYADPNATVAWSDGLNVKVSADEAFRHSANRGPGESLQMTFTGKGWVMLQPYEEMYLQNLPL